MNEATIYVNMNDLPWTWLRADGSGRGGSRTSGSTERRRSREHRASRRSACVPAARAGTCHPPPAPSLQPPTGNNSYSTSAIHCRIVVCGRISTV